MSFFPSVFLASYRSPHSLLDSFLNLHNINRIPLAEDFRNKNRILVVQKHISICRTVPVSLCQGQSSCSHHLPLKDPGNENGFVSCPSPYWRRLNISRSNQRLPNTISNFKHEKTEEKRTMISPKAILVPRPFMFIVMSKRYITTYDNKKNTSWNRHFS